MDDQIIYKTSLYITPTEQLWIGQLGTGNNSQQVTILKVINPSPEWINASLLHEKEISRDRKLGKLVLKCVSVEHKRSSSILLVDSYLTICYEPVLSTMESCIEQSSTPYRSRAWFQTSGLLTMQLLLLSLKLLHKQSIVHQSINLSTIFFTTDHVFKLGDFRKAEKVEEGLEQMRKDVIDLGSTFLYFLGNCTNNKGPPVGDQAVKTAIQNMHPDLYDFLVEEMCDLQGNLTARRAYRRLATMKNDGLQEIPRNPVQPKQRKPTFPRMEERASVRKGLEDLRKVINGSNPLHVNEAKQQIREVQGLLRRLGGDLQISGNRMEPSSRDSEPKWVTYPREVELEFDEMQISDKANSQEYEFFPTKRNGAI